MQNFAKAESESITSKLALFRKKPPLSELKFDN